MDKENQNILRVTSTPHPCNKIFQSGAIHLYRIWDPSAGVKGYLVSRAKLPAQLPTGVYSGYYPDYSRAKEIFLSRVKSRRAKYPLTN